MLIKPSSELSEKELFSLSRVDRELYIERYVLSLLEANKETGLTLNQFDRIITFVSKPTLSKYLNTLLAKRQIYKVQRSNTVEYYPNHRPLHPLINKILNFDRKRYKFQIISYEDGLYLYIQEINKNLYGKEEIAGGILVALNDLGKVNDYLKYIETEKIKIIEDFKEQKINEFENKINGGDE